MVFNFIDQVHRIQFFDERSKAIMKKIPIDGSHQKELSSDAEDFYSDYWISEVGISEESLRRHQEMLGYVFSEPPRSLKIAEIGIGAEGGVLLLLKEANDVFGLDVSSVAVEMCKRRGIHAALYNGDNERLPFEDNSIDVLFACEVFEHFANPQHALEEVRRTLKPGGIFALSIPNPFIHHWPRLFYPTLIDREPFREFLMVNRFKILKEVGIGSNHYRSTTLSDEDVWSWFWVCQNSKNGDSRGLFHSGQYFFQKRAPLGVRKFPIEAADLF